MGRPRSKPQRGKALVRELWVSLLTIPAITLGLLLIAVFFQVAIEETTGVLTGLLAFGLALGATAVALMLIAWGAAQLLAPAAAGWLAIFAGQLPADFGPDARNLARGVANLIFAVAAAILGVMLFRYGVREGELNFAVEGIFLCGSGVLLGVVPAVPRLYFARRGRQARADELEEIEADGVIVLLAAVGLGIGLSLALCFGINDNRAPHGVRTLRPGIWSSGCVAKEARAACVPTARHAIEATRAGRVTLQTRPLCAQLKTLGQDGQIVRGVPWVDLYRAGVKTLNKEQEIRIRAIDLVAGQRLLLELSTSGKASCVYKVRYFDRPPQRTATGGGK